MQSADKNGQNHPENDQNDSNNEETPELHPKKSTNKATVEKLAIMEHAQQQLNRFFQSYLNRALECPIGLENMTDPVVVSNGYTFDRKNISDSIRVRGWQCPVTRQRLKQMQFIPNLAMRSLIDEYAKFTKKQQSFNRSDFNKSKKKSNRLTIEEYQKRYTHLDIDKPKRLLKHDFKKVVMKDFVRCNWNLIQQMDFSFCSIDDQAIELFLKHGKTHFKNLRVLHLNSNEIKNIKELERLPELRALSMQNNDSLSQETKDYFRRINLMKGKLKIKY